MRVSADKALIDHARKLATQARDPAPHYEHSEIGYNYRMSNVLRPEEVPQRSGVEPASGRGQLRVGRAGAAQADVCGLLDQNTEITNNKSRYAIGLVFVIEYDNG